LLLVLFILGGGLRAWATISFPLIDVNDLAPLWAALAAGAVFAFALAMFGRDRTWVSGAANPVATRWVVALFGLVFGVSLGAGLFVAGNAFLDRAPVRWMPYTVEGHPHGRNGSRLELREDRADGVVHYVWLPDRPGTAGMEIGARVEVPAKPGAFGSAWLAGDVRKAP
jgi:hypothetical protein